MKNVSRCLAGREAVVWEFLWQDEVKEIHAYGDSDWEDRKGSRKSTSGLLVMLGPHCIKTWSSTQGAVALSSAEAEFYATIEAVIRPKGVLSVITEVGFLMTAKVHAFTDKQRGKTNCVAGRFRTDESKPLEIIDLRLQQEVGLGMVLENKVEGTRNPADLMTKYFKRWEIEVRLRLAGIRVDWRSGCQEEDEEMLNREVHALGLSLLRGCDSHCRRLLIFV